MLFLRIWISLGLLWFGGWGAQGEAPMRRPVIRNLQILTPELARYELFELRFDLTTAATHPSLPYDRLPPRGLENIRGVSAEAIFTSPSRHTWIQPAFLYQPYRSVATGEKDHLIPTGRAYWLVRFTPQEVGRWSVRVRVQDAGGITMAPAENPLDFIVIGPSSQIGTRRGFLRVAEMDARYFEFSDGSPFHGAGFNTGFDSAAAATRELSQFGKNGVTLVRSWLSTAGINGSQWTPWASFHLEGNGYLPGVSYSTRDTYADHDLAYRLDPANPCLFQGWRQGPVAVEAATTYTVWARVKVTGSGLFMIKTGQWLGKDCNHPDSGTAVTAPVRANGGWREVTGIIHTEAGQTWLDYFYLTFNGAGEVLIDEVKLFRAGDPSQVNLLMHGQADAHLNFDPLLAARWDGIIQAAETNGVYLKLVVDEKNEWIRNRITAEGDWSDEADNQYFYAAPNAKARWLQEAWWRYLIARWGYSPAIHSFEYVNEGDPYNGNHYEAAAAMAAYFDRYDPSRHMVTTSFWHSFPNREFWSEPRYAAIDYADIHAYLTTGWDDQNAGLLGDLQIDRRVSFQGAPAIQLNRGNVGAHSITVRGLVLREAGEWQLRYWMRAENLLSACSAGGGVWIRWSLDDGRSGGAPGISQGAVNNCAGHAGSYNWRALSSGVDRNGNRTADRLVIAAGKPAEIRVTIQNQDTQRGAAWISRVELVSPSGQITPVIGQFDLTPFLEDPGWYGASYGLLFGGASPVGAGKPLIRGESGIDTQNAGIHPDLNKDREGVWLHDILWAQLSPGGMIDLPWYTSETILENQDSGRVPGLLPLYHPYAQFVADIPLNNGLYRDAAAISSNPILRVWGQMDRQNGRGYLWIKNKGFTWQAAVNGRQVKPVNGTVTIQGLAPGAYQVTWWNTWKTSQPQLKTETLNSMAGSLTLTLPQALSRDVAVKIEPKE